jgi:hypothetical protein
MPFGTLTLHRDRGRGSGGVVFERKGVVGSAGAGNPLFILLIRDLFIFIRK